MIVYKCDMCGEIHEEIGEMTNVIISHAGISEVNYPKNGRYQICKDCTSKLLKSLNVWGVKDGEEK